MAKKKKSGKETGLDMSAWKYYPHTDGTGAGYHLYKSRHNNQGKTFLSKPPKGAIWSKIGNYIEKGDWLYFDVTEETSELEEGSLLYNRYSYSKTYRIKKDGA